ncbi:hypothetical protein BGZ98_001577 [Dissophora globulifera]|nr:hypothetical protein BGZ98_001577 [Dissophora globulifera]
MLKNPGYQRSSSGSAIGSSHTLRRTSPSNSTGNLPDTVLPPGMPSASDLARKRQVRKDDAIRKKLDQELGRKKPSTRGTHGATRPIHGTVGSLRPSQALTLMDTAMVIDAARADAVLVIDRDSTLVGIMTDKDLAFRVVAEGLDIRTTLISQVMTRNPFCVTTDTNATEALNKMVNGGFRHLPCLNADGDVVGLLDITKCLYEALEKLEKAHKSSKQLVEALEGMQADWAQAANPGLRSYVDIMREKMASPDLNIILEENHGVAEIHTKTSVRDASRVMKQVHATASLIMEDGRIAGIFTTKDIVVRVLAAGLEPDRTSVIRVMTPRPDTVNCSMTILEALKKMHDNHYLHLPVVDDLGHMAGLVDVLQVSLAMLRQMNTIQQGDSAVVSASSTSEGPVWNKFWETTFNHKEDTGSEVSSSMPTTPTETQFGGTTIRTLPSIVTSNIGASAGPYTAGRSGSRVGASSPENEMSAEFVFKFQDQSGQVHRFSSSSRSFKELHEKIVEKMRGQKREQEASDVALSYCDEENDQVVMVQDSDVVDAVKMALRNQWPLIRISVVSPSMLAPTPVPLLTPTSAPVSVPEPTQSEVRTTSTAKDTGDAMDARKVLESIHMATGLDPTMIASGVGIGLGVGLALVYAIMRK